MCCSCSVRFLKRTVVSVKAVTVCSRLQTLTADTTVQTAPGLGVSGKATDDDHAIHLGSAAYLQTQGLKESATLNASLETAMTAGQAVALIGWNGQAQAAFVFEESLRPNATQVLYQGQALPLEFHPGAVSVSRSPLTFPDPPS